MTAIKLYTRIRPTTTSSEIIRCEDEHMNYNFSSIFTRLIKDAARCNRFSSDVFYELERLYRIVTNFDRERDVCTPIFIGFRKDGVDGTDYVLNRLATHSNSGPSIILSTYYFALYSIMVEHVEDDYYKITFNEYAV